MTEAMSLKQAEREAIEALTVITLDRQGKQWRHGKSAYWKRGCRCVVCTAEASAYAFRYRKRCKQRLPPEHVHGTSAGYQHWGCRCEPCRSAERTRARSYREEQARRAGRPTSAERAGDLAQDLRSLAEIAAPGDSELALARKLSGRRSADGGEWHKIKVHRRVARLKRDLGVTGRAGDVVLAWSERGESP